MSLARVIPVLLLGKDGLVKTERFANHRYIGDPLNAVRIYNEKQVDELTLLDINATVQNYQPKFSLLKRIAAECRMPLCYGGGIKDFETAEKLISLGIEKVSLSSAAINDFSIVSKIASALGSQSTVVCIDYARGWMGKRSVTTHNGTKKKNGDIRNYIKQAVDAGAGEIILNSITDDGSMKGYDLEFAAEIAESVKIPMTFIGGAGSLADISELFEKCGNIGAGAGSLFVYKGALRGVLINYPSQDAKKRLRAKE